MESLHVYDTTLRDGTQGAGFVPSIGDKLAIARHLDDLGCDFVEGGWPGANPKDAGFFARASEELHLRHATLAAFGATRKAGRKAVDDPQVRALLDAQTSLVTLVAKAHAGQVERALRTTRAENLAMVTDTVALLRAEDGGCLLMSNTSSTGSGSIPNTPSRSLPLHTTRAPRS